MLVCSLATAYVYGQFTGQPEFWGVGNEEVQTPNFMLPHPSLQLCYTNIINLLKPQ